MVYHILIAIVASLTLVSRLGLSSPQSSYATLSARARVNGPLIHPDNKAAFVNGKAYIQLDAHQVMIDI